MAGEIVPLTEINSEAGEYLAWRVPLPEFVPADNIGINLERVRRLTRLGGLRHLRVDTYQGEQTTYDAQLGSMGPDGSATASLKGMLNRADLSKSTVQLDDASSGPKFSETSWGDGMISINTSELNNKIMEQARNTSLRDPRPWSKLLDKAVRSGISKAASDQLLGDVSFPSRAYLGWAVFDTFQSNHWHTNAGLIPNALFASAEWQLMGAIMAGLMGMAVGERRLSLIPAYQLDRLIAVKGLARTQRLIQPIG